MAPKHLSLLIGLIAALSPLGAALITAALSPAPTVVVAPVVVLVTHD